MRYIAATIIVCLIFSCNELTERMPHFTVHGIDVSHYQSRINWDTIVSQEISFAFVKATEGEEFLDSLFRNNWSDMKRVGIKRGAYHFLRPGISAFRQAQNFINHVNLEAGDLPPVLDIEVADGATDQEVRESVRLWLKMVEYHYEVRPIIYTNLKFFNRYINHHFDGYHFWIARYNTKKPELENGQKWHFWQYGNRGLIKGIEGFVDFNVFNGTLIELEAMCLSNDPIYSAR